MNNNIVTNLDVGTGLILLITKIEDTESIELGSRLFSGCRNIERCIAISATCSICSVVGNLANLTLYKYIVSLLILSITGPCKIGYCGSSSCRSIRILKSTGTKCLLSARIVSAGVVSAGAKVYTLGKVNGCALCL